MTIPLSTAGEVFLGHLKDVICPTLHAGQEDVPIFGKTILGNIQPGQLGNVRRRTVRCTLSGYDAADTMLLVSMRSRNGIIAASVFGRGPL